MNTTAIDAVLGFALMRLHTSKPFRSGRPTSSTTTRPRITLTFLQSLCSTGSKVCAKVTKTQGDETVSKRFLAQWIAISIALLATMVAAPAYAEEPALALFKAKCAMCHGADASGNTAMGKKFNIPDLRAPEIQRKTKAELGNSIAKGKNKMPAFEGKITSDEVSELATYVRQLKK